MTDRDELARRPCWNCNGTGLLDYEKHECWHPDTCETCNGTGWTAREASDRVAIKTIGHVDNEKTALTAAIAQAAQTNPEDPKP